MRSSPRRTPIVVTLLIAAAGYAACLSFWDDIPDKVLTQQLLDAMTPEEQLAQTLMLGWLGQEPSDEITEWITTTNLGGVKIFGWNGGDLLKLGQTLGTMQAMAAETRFGIPLLTATDQEGGWVRHVKGDSSLTTSLTPGNMAIGASTLPFDSYWSAYYIGVELRALGINMNFAPAVDVYVNPEASVIGPRAFSSDPVQTGMLGVAYFHGMEDSRVIATAKHFPGHGNASGDSHGILPVIQDDKQTLWDRDLVPFRFLIGEGVPAVLSGHLSFPNVSGDERPASLSPYFKNTLLREELGFDGLVLTDDLYMAGALDYGTERDWDVGQVVMESIRVGNDMAMLSRTPEPGGPIWDRLVQHYQNDPDFRDRVREAAGRVIKLKLEYLKPDDRVPLQPDAGTIRELMQTAESLEFFRDQAGRSITLVRDQALPLQPDKLGRILLAGKDPDFLRVAAEFFPTAEQFRIQSPALEFSSKADRDGFVRAATGSDTIVFCLADPNSLEVLQGIESLGKRVIVLSILTPVYLADLPWIKTAIAVYGWGDESYRAGFSALLGRFSPEGVLPVRLPGIP